MLTVANIDSADLQKGFKTANLVENLDMQAYYTPKLLNCKLLKLLNCKFRSAREWQKV